MKSKLPYQIIGGLAALGIFVTGRLLDDADRRDREQRLAQASYDQGVRNGRAMGQCDAIGAAARAHPQPAWALSPAVIDALQICGAVLKKHAPGSIKAVLAAPLSAPNRPEKP